jgi:uncharacterized protein
VNVADTQPGYPFRFACRRSGNCCSIPGGIVRVTPAEKTAIAAQLGMSEQAFASRYLQPDGVRLKDGYAVRPAKCREWPFWPELLRDPELLRLVQRTCPGIEPLDAAGRLDPA